MRENVIPVPMSDLFSTNFILKFLQPSFYLKEKELFLMNKGTETNSERQFEFQR